MRAVLFSGLRLAIFAMQFAIGVERRAILVAHCAIPGQRYAVRAQSQPDVLARCRTQLNACEVFALSTISMWLLAGSCTLRRTRGVIRMSIREMF